jgi:hypothetical protein
LGICLKRGDGHAITCQRWTGDVRGRGNAVDDAAGRAPGAVRAEWEPRLIVDGHIVLAERCPRGAEAFALADAWKRRMLDKGWRQVVPATKEEAVAATASRDVTAPAG